MATYNEEMETIVLDKTDSVVNRYLAEMRNVETQGDRMRFRRNIERIGSIMAYEVSKRLAYEAREVTTPLDKAVVRLPSESLVVGTILRAGLPMHQGVLDIFDDADNCFVSAWRAYDKRHDVEIHLGYAATPRLNGKTLIVADPMLATGCSMVQTLRELMRYGVPSHIHILAIIGAQAGVDYLAANALDVETTLWVATVDPTLNADSYIVPGLGDAGDLAYGGKI